MTGRRLAVAVIVIGTLLGIIIAVALCAALVAVYSVTPVNSVQLPTL